MFVGESARAAALRGDAVRPGCCCDSIGSEELTGTLTGEGELGRGIGSKEGPVIMGGIVVEVLTGAAGTDGCVDCDCGCGGAAAI